MKNTRVSLIAFAICAVFLYGCNSGANETNTDEDIVLKIGQVEITRYEFERQKKRSFDPDQGADYQFWLNEFINDVYLLADAYDKKYDTLSSIRKTVKYTALDMIGKRNGYLWNAVEKPKLNFSDEELRAIYEKRNRIFTIQYIFFPDKNKLMSQLEEGLTSISVEKFDELLHLQNEEEGIYYHSNEYQFPFNELFMARDSLLHMKKESVFYTGSGQGIYVIYLADIKDISLPPFEEIKSQIKNTVTQTKIRQILTEKHEKVFGMANIKVFPKAKEALLSHVLYFLKHNDYTLSYPQDTVVTYLLENKESCITIAGFMEQYTNAMISSVIRNMKKLDISLKNTILFQYLYLEAERLGITKDPAFVLDKRLYQNAIMLNAYITREFSGDSVVPEEEIIAFYEKERQHFTGPVSAVVTIYRFDNEEAAMAARQSLLSELRNEHAVADINSLQIEGLAAIEKDIPISFEDTARSFLLRQQILSLETNQLNGPVAEGNQFILFYKTREEGIRIKSYHEMSDELYRHLLQQKIQAKKEARVKLLKETYPVTLKEI